MTVTYQFTYEDHLIQNDVQTIEVPVQASTLSSAERLALQFLYEVIDDGHPGRFVLKKVEVIES